MIGFVNREDGLFAPEFDGGSLVSVAQLGPGQRSLDEYQRTVAKILKFDRASPEEKATLLVEILNDNYVSQQSAQEIFHLDKPSDFPTMHLVSPLIAITKDDRSQLAVPAIQALGGIANKPLIPTLLELLASPNVYVRQTTFHIFKDKTAAPLLFDPNGRNGSEPMTQISGPNSGRKMRRK